LIGLGGDTRSTTSSFLQEDTSTSVSRKGTSKTILEGTEGSIFEAILRVFEERGSIGRTTVIAKT